MRPSNFLWLVVVASAPFSLAACNCSTVENPGPDGGDSTTAGDGDGGGGEDAGADDAEAGCSFGTAASLATPGSLDLFGQVSYFADGGALPQGRYRVSYVDGCMKYSGSQGWTIHAYANGSIAWWLVGASTSQKYLMPPGTVGWNPADGAFTAFADCVAANLALAPTDFDFDGGVLGVWLQDSPYSDNLAGESGRNPTWNLTGLGPCAP